MITLKINGSAHQLDVEPDTPLLWVLRDTLGLTATKYGCGIGQCGACTVHLDGAAIRSCVTPVSSVTGRAIITLEGLSDRVGEAVKRAWIAEDVPQCGYCQPGQIMGASALLARNPRPSDADINGALAGNLCRCGTYLRIRRAVHHAAKLLET